MPTPEQIKDHNDHVEHMYETIGNFCDGTRRLKGWSFEYNDPTPGYERDFKGFIDRSDWKPASPNAPTWQRMFVLQKIYQKGYLLKVLKRLGYGPEDMPIARADQITKIATLVLISNQRICEALYSVLKTEKANAI